MVCYFTKTALVMVHLSNLNGVISKSTREQIGISKKHIQ